MTYRRRLPSMPSENQLKAQGITPIMSDTRYEKGKLEFHGLDKGSAVIAKNYDDYRIVYHGPTSNQEGSFTMYTSRSGASQIPPGDKLETFKQEIREAAQSNEKLKDYLETNPLPA